MTNRHLLLVSVILPVHNGKLFLTEAIKSVFQQTYQPYEIIIIGDESTYDTAKILAEYPQHNIQTLYQPNQGPAAARNAGLRIAKGNIIAFIDSDDIWVKNKLDIQLSYLNNNSTLEIIRGHTQMIFTNDAPTELKYPGCELPKAFFHFGSILCRKSVFDKIGLLDESLYFGEDHDWFARAKANNIFMQLHDDVVYIHRRHANNTTNDLPKVYRGHFDTIKKSIERIRKNNSHATETSN